MRFTSSSMMAVFLFAASPAFAHGGPGGSPEAAAACDGKSDGAACSFTGHGHDVAGTCGAGKDGKLACRPAAPPEFAAACSGKAEGDACTVDLHGKSFTSTCGKNHEGALSCKPPHEGHHGHHGDKPADAPAAK